MPFLRRSFRIIFILIRYVATIPVKAFYDEALRIVSNTGTIFSWYQSTELQSSCRVFTALADRMAWLILL